MNTIIFKVTGNRMTRVGGYDPVSGEKKYTEFRFEFDYEWNGVRSITVTMFFDVREPQNIVVDVENGVAVCNIEEELRNKSGILWVGVSGYDTVSGATLDCYLTALPVGEGTKVTEVATTLLYQQIVELVGRIETKLPVSTLYIQDLAVTTAKLADGAVTGEKVKENTLTPDKFDREYWEHLNRSTINTYADLDNIIATDTKLNTAFTVMFTGLSPIKSVVGEGTFFVLKSNTSESLLLINVDNGEMWSYTQGANEVTRASVTKEDLAVTTEKLADGAVTGEKVKENTLTPDKFDREYWEKKVYTKVIDSYTGLFSSIVPINSGGSICIANLNIITGAGRLSGYCEIVAVLEDTGTGMYITDLGDGSCWRIFKEKDKEVFSAFHNEDIRYLAKSSTNLGEVISDFDTLFQKVGYISMGGTVGFVKILVSDKDKVTVTGNDGVLDGEFMAVGSPTFTDKTIYLRNLFNGECWTVVHNGDGSYLATKIDGLTPRVEHLEKYSVINLGAVANKESLKNVSFNVDNLYRFSFTGELKNQIELPENDCLGTYGYENGPGRHLKFINLENGKSGVYWIDLGSYVEHEGIKGEDGQDGENGKSAYEIAVDKGFNGTEDEWIESFKVNVGTDINAEYFAITDDGEISLKPEYRGASTKSDFEQSISDMGLGVAGSKNAELPKDLVIPDILNGIAVNSLARGMFLENRVVENITLPSTVDVIPDRFCDKALNLKAINNTERIISVGVGAFQSSSLIKIFLPKLKTFAGAGQFNNCGYLTYADIGEVERISQTAFGYCVSLSKVKNASNVSVIEQNAFLDTYNLKNIDLTSKLTSIGKSAFFPSKVDFDWSSLQNCTFDTNATKLQVNPTDFWSGLTPVACENPLPTVFCQQDDRWVNRAINGSYTYKTACGLMCCLHVYCGFNNLAMESVVEFENVLNAINTDLLTSYIGLSTTFKNILDSLGFTTTIYNGTDATKLNAIYSVLANGGYAIAGVSGTGKGSVVGHVVTIYGVNENKELLVADSEKRYHNDSTKPCKYAIPFSNLIAHNVEVMTVSK